MVICDRKLLEPGCLQTVRNDLGCFLDPAQLPLDGDFPHAGGRDKHFGGVRKDGPGILAQTRIGLHDPEKDLGVEKKSHRSASKSARMSSGSGASKSSATWI